MVYAEIINWFGGFFIGLESSIPERYQILVGLALYTLFILLYSLFIWKFYKFLARKDIIKFNLTRYNRTQNPGLEKFFAIILNTIEYVIILPFLVLFWFAILAFFILVLSESSNVLHIMLITGAIIAATRVTAYISEDLSKDIAKIFPFTILATFLLNPDFFNVGILFEKIVQIPSIFQNILIFMVFIFAIEFVLRGLYTIVELTYSDKTSEGEPVSEETGSE